MAEGKETGSGGPEWRSDFSPGTPEEYLKRFEGPRMEVEMGEEDRDPRERYWSSGILEKLTSREQTKTPEQLRWRTWRLLEGVVDRQDDWTARMIRDRFASRLEELGEEQNSALQSYLGGQPETSPSESKDKFYSEFKDMEKEAKAVLSLFIDFGNYYEKVAARSADLAKVAFSNEIVELNPVDVIQKIFELRGFQTKKEAEGGEWPILGDQIDTTIRAYAYIATCSDERLKEEKEWMENSEGFKLLFPEGAGQARDWIRKLKLSILPHVNQELADLVGKSLDELTDDDVARLDKELMINRFALPLSVPHINTIEGSIRDLAVGEVEEGNDKKRFLLETQARIAEKLGRKVFRYFGVASYYGGLVETVDGEKDYSAEGHPWSDGFLSVLDTEARIGYNIQKGYWPGPETFVKKAPDRLYTHFFRFLGTKDPDELKRTRKIRTAWTQMWEDGKRLRDFPWERAGDFPVKSYWIRYVFLYMSEVQGIEPTFMGKEWIDEPKMLLSHRFWKDARKAISIVLREPVVTNGDYERWFSDRQGEIDRLKKRFGISDEAAEKRVMKDALDAEKKRWKDIIVESATKWHHPKQPTLVGVMKEAIKEANFYEP